MRFSDWIKALGIFFLPFSLMADKCCPEYKDKCLQPLPPDKGCVPDLFKRYDQIMSTNAEFLYWTIGTGGLDYAIKMRRDAWGPTASFAQGRYEKGTYDLDPGVRVGLLYFRAPHYWEMRWEFTRMTNRGKNYANKPQANNQFLTPTWALPSTAPITSAHSNLHFNYNVFDWAVTRVFFPNPHLRFRAVAGVMTAWMDQYWKVRYIDSSLDRTTIVNRWDFTGAGLKVGSIVDWYWTGRLYMTARGSLGILVGNYTNHSKQITTFQPTGSDNPSVPIRNASYQDVRGACVGQMMLGPSYQRNFPNYRLELFAGFEMNAWCNVQEIYRSSSASLGGARETWINTNIFTLYGLTTRATFDF